MKQRKVGAIQYWWCDQIFSEIIWIDVWLGKAVAFANFSILLHIKSATLPYVIRFENIWQVFSSLSFNGYVFYFGVAFEKSCRQNNSVCNILRQDEIRNRKNISIENLKIIKMLQNRKNSLWVESFRIQNKNYLHWLLRWTRRRKAKFASMEFASIFFSLSLTPLNTWNTHFFQIFEDSCF